MLKIKTKQKKKLRIYVDGWGFPLGEHKEVIEMERMTAKKKAQECSENRA